MKTINKVVLTIEFYDDLDDKLAAGEVQVDIDYPEDIHVGALIDACQRAVANAIETLKNNLDNVPKLG